MILGYVPNPDPQIVNVKKLIYNSDVCTLILYWLRTRVLLLLIFLEPVIMSKILLRAAVFILSHFLLPVDCVSGAEIEAMYSEILARVQRRRTNPAAIPEDFRKGTCSRKYSQEQAQLIQDVTLIFGNSMTVLEKFERFKALMTELGVAEEPVSFERFQEFSRIINRHHSGQDKCTTNRGKKSPKIATPVSEKLLQMLSEKASLSSEEALEALEQSGVDPLPSIKDIQHWLNYRKKVSGFLKLVAEPCVERTAARDASLDSVETSKLLHAEEECGSSEVSQSNILHEGADACAIEADSRHYEGGDDYSDKGGEESETYKMLLRNASTRRERTFLKESSRKYTIEHDALVMDVVTTLNRDSTISRQFEIFKKLLRDLGMVEMSRGSFAERATAARKSLGGDAGRGSRNVGKATLRFLNYLFDKDPKISAAEALKALESQPRDSKSPIPSLEKVRSLLKYRTAMKRLSEKKMGMGINGQELLSDDVDLWNEVGQAFADGAGSSHPNSSLKPNCIDDAELWKKVSLALADPDVDENIPIGVDMYNDEVCQEGFAGSSSADQEASRKRKRSD